MAITIKTALKHFSILTVIYATVLVVLAPHCLAKNSINDTYSSESQYQQVLDNESYQVIIESGTIETLNFLVKRAQSEHINKKTMGDIIQWTSQQLLNSPYVFYLLDKTTPEYLYISLSKTDCVLFVEEVIVVSQLIKNNQLNLSNYIAGIKQIRYHGNVVYCNRNHYFKDWVTMNERNGIVTDVGASLTQIKLPFSANILGDIISQDKTNIHYNNLNCIKDREKFVNTESIGFIPLQELPKYLKYIHNGDIIGIIRTANKSDSVHHLGIAYVHDGTVSMIHASSVAKKVVVAPSLAGYLAKFKDSLGIILIRVK